MKTRIHLAIFFQPITARMREGHEISRNPNQTQTLQGYVLRMMGKSTFEGAVRKTVVYRDASNLKMISEGNGIGPELVSVEPRADHGQQGLAVWFTGLSGAGKTTICKSVHAEMLTRGYRVETLDADVVRKQFWPDLGFGKVDRDENIRRIGSLAQLLTRNGIIALVAAISPYRVARHEVRKTIRHFLEVYVDAPLHVCEERDPKGLYRRARLGELHGFTGIDDPYEAPLAPDIRCATDRDTVNVCRDQVVSAILRYFS